jgi:hypothetical protein
MSAALRWKTTLANHRIANLISVTGGIIYLIQSWIYAQSQASLLDEGAYLYKGYLFAIGKYWPYQDYGPWTNHMPLSFLIPGYAQAIFGPGLRTGRYLAVSMGLLMLLGLWVITRRLGGPWWAALAVWAMALNPAVIKLYSLANTQSLVACMLVWVLVLTLGGDRPLWQVLLGSGLAGLMLVTRVNLFPVLAFLLVYIFWEYGGKVGWYSTLSGLVPVAIVHAIYWPGILKIWAHWIPRSLVPFLDPWRYPIEALPSWNPKPTLETRILSFFQGFRFHFVALIGALSVLLLWPFKRLRKSNSRFKVVVFLISLFGLLILLHMWASLGKSYCVFCYPVYLSFFVSLGLILIVAAFVDWEENLPLWQQVLIGVIILILAAGIGYSASLEIGDNLLPLLSIKVPRIRSLQVLSGSVELGGLIQNYYGLTAEDYEPLMKLILPTVIGFFVGLGIVFISILIYRRRTRREGLSKISLGLIALVLFMVIGYIFTPTVVFGGGYNTYDCGGDVISSYEAAGRHLNAEIPAGSLVYWKGGNSIVPMLYLQDVEIYPAQINGDYSFRLGGTPEALESFGFWSEELALEWAEEADFILIEERFYKGWLRELVESGDFDELEPTAPTVGCRRKSAIHIFQRQQ